MNQNPKPEHELTHTQRAMILNAKADALRNASIFEKAQKADTMMADVSALVIGMAKATDLLLSELATIKRELAELRGEKRELGEVVTLGPVC